MGLDPPIARAGLGPEPARAEPVTRWQRPADTIPDLAAKGGRQYAQV
jgi:hypothetical protein